MGEADHQHNVTDKDRALVGGEIYSNGYGKVYAGSEHDLNKNFTRGNTLEVMIHVVIYISPIGLGPRVTTSALPLAYASIIP